MANVLVQESSLQDIADAIRAKNGTQDTYKPSEMSDAIDDLNVGGITPTGTISITADGTYDVTNYASAEVDTDSGSTLGTKSITANGTYTASDDSLDGYSSVTVNVPSGSNMDSGTFTPESNTNSFFVTVTEGVTHFIFYATDFDDGTADAGWHTVGGYWVNGVANSHIRYNQANTNGTSATVTLSGTTLTFATTYNIRTEKTYQWYAW